MRVEVWEKGGNGEKRVEREGCMTSAVVRVGLKRRSRSSRLASLPAQFLVAPPQPQGQVFFLTAGGAGGGTGGAGRSAPRTGGRCCVQSLRYGPSLLPAPKHAKYAKHAPSAQRIGCSAIHAAAAASPGLYTLTSQGPRTSAAAATIWTDT